MNFDSAYFGPQALTDADADYRGSTFSEVRDAVFRNPYYLTWGADDEPPLPVYAVTLGRTLRGLLRLGRRWLFQGASDRTVDSHADLRWGPDRRGFRRLLHPNGVCLTGEWQIDADADTRYSGYFKAGSRALVIARCSTCCTETRRGRLRSLALAGKLYPTSDRAHEQPLRPANFITQEDLGGSRSDDVSQVELRNAPDVTPWRRGWGLPILLLTALVLRRTDRQPTIRQLYEIAELGKPVEAETRAPRFMRLLAEPPPAPPADPDLDFRDEILGRIYDRGGAAPKRTLTFHVEVSDMGYGTGILVKRRVISRWQRIGRIVFDAAVASYNGDFVIHFHHPAWRRDRDDPRSTVRRRHRVG